MARRREQITFVGSEAFRLRRPFGLIKSRRGAAAVEFALTAPLIFLFVFFGIEVGRFQMASRGLDAAAREGCRTAVERNASQVSVERAVAERLASFGISGYTLTTSPSSVSSASAWEPITVQIDVSYDQVSWLPAPRFLQKINLQASSTLPQESDQSNP